MLLSELLKHGSKTLKQENIHTHLLDAELFLSNLLNTSREKILTLNDQKVSEEIIFNFNGLRIFQDNPIIKFHKNFIE